MKYTRTLLLLIITCLFSFLPVEGITKVQALKRVLFNSTTNWHYAPVPLDDDYSRKVFDGYLERIDPTKRYLLQEDVNELKFYRNMLDDELFKGTEDFFELSNKITTKRVNQVKSFYGELIQEKFSYIQSDSVELDFKKLSYKKDIKALKNYWRKVIKFQILSQYITLIEAEEDEKKEILEKTSAIKLDAKIEEKARKKVKEQLDQHFERLLEETKEDKQNLYLDSLMNVYDAHTSYFPPDRKEDFDISITGKLEGIGAVLREDGGFIKVVRIVHGSAAFKQGELKAEDIILKVGEGKSKDTYDLVGARVKDAVKQIRGKKGTVVKLTVKKPSGKITTIPITRDVVVIEDTYAKSILIKDDRYNKTFGYIYLPKFYRDFKDDLGRNTTDDVRRALLDIQENNVQGIILDLRNNEGGALQDAVKTAGLFIDRGPVVQVKGRNAYSSVLRDTKSGTTYDGPLIVMINKYSASASEILAAALQDYQRAVIVGSESSYGKGTVQTFVNLENQYPMEFKDHKPLGDLKLTIQKFYRINGGSTQYKGVEPDIVLPDANGYLEVGEQYLPNSLPWDTVKPLRYKKWNKQDLKLDTLRQKSNSRVSKSEAFAELQTYVDLIKQEREDTEYSLVFINALDKKKRIEEESDRFDTVKEELSHITFITTDLKPLNEKQKEWTEDLAEDIYLNETLSIMNDLVKP